MRMTVYFFCLLASVLTALIGCAEIPADNPYDPNAPVTVQATGVVRGRVLLPVGIAPALLADARVTLTSQVDGNAQRTVGLDAAGAFTFDEVRPGDWRLVAALDGFGASPALFRVGIGASVDLGELLLSARTGVLTGRVRLRGAPDDGHAGTRVVARETGVQAVTGPDGAFTLGLVARSHTLQLVPPSGFLLPERWRETAVEIVAGETASLSGDEEIWCEPPATYAVSGTLQSPLPVADWPLRSLVQATGGGVVRVATVTTTEDGRGAFQIAGLLPGDYALSALVVGHHALRRDVTLGAADVDVGALALVPDRADFQGVVVRAGGAPVEGVVVRARRGAVTAATALTDVEGAFSLLLTPETHALSLSHPDFEPLADVYLDFTEAGFTVRDLAAPPFELQPRPAAALGGPVASTLGALEDWPGRAFATLTSADGLIRRFEPVLDAERGRGRLEFAGLPPGPYTLGVTAQGHLPFIVSVDLPAGRSTLGDVLRPGVTPGVAEIDGEIGLWLTPEADDADSALVLRGRVALAGREDHGGVILRATVGGNLVATAVSDPSGAFAFLTSRATHELGFSRDGFAERTETVEWDDAEARFESQDRPLDGVEFTLSPLPTAALVGQLQSPLQIDDWANRAFVTLVSADEAVRRLEPVLRDGGFQFTDVPPGDYRLSVSARGHLPATENVTLVEGENGPVRIALTPEGFDAETATLLVGRVHLADVPDDGDHSDVTVRGRIGGNLVFTTMTDDSGAFLFPVARESHVLTFTRNNYQPSAEHVITWRVDEALPEGGRFEYEGRPLAEVVFSLEPRQTAALTGRLTSPLRIDDWPARALVSLFGDGVQRLATVSQEAGEGRFEAAGLRPGAYTLAVQALGHAPVVRMLELPAEGLDLGPLPLAPQSVPFTGLVVDPDGAPVEGAVIRAERDDVTAATGLSDADGEFTLLLTPETHVLSLSADGFAPLRDVFLDWTADDRFEVRDLDAPPFVMVPLPTAVTGRVVRELPAGGFAPAGGATVSLMRGPGSVAVGVTDPEGVFVLPGVSAGLVELSVDLARHESAHLPLLLSGEMVDAGTLSLRIGRGVLSGQARRAGGTPTGLVTVIAIGAPGDPLVSGRVYSAQASPPADGFRLDGLPAGLYEVTAVADAYRSPAPVPVTVTPDAESAVDLVLTARTWRVIAPTYAGATATIRVERDPDLTFVQLAVGSSVLPPGAPFVPLAPSGEFEVPLVVEGPNDIAVRLANEARSNLDPGDDLLAAMSPVITATINRDTTPPAWVSAPPIQPLVVAEGRATVRERTVPVSLHALGADFLAIWEASAGDCGDPSCADPRFVPYSPAIDFTLSETRELKTVCARLCDMAGNASHIEKVELNLDVHVPRPVPSLDRLRPRSFVARSVTEADADDPDRPSGEQLVIEARGLAPDTRALVGVYTLPCALERAADDCRADPEGGCAPGGNCAEVACAARCTVDLPVSLLQTAGTFPVRLHTPDPVEGGAGISQRVASVDVVAPKPTLLGTQPRGVRLGPGGPVVGESLSLTVDGCDLLNNAQYSLGDIFGAVQDIRPTEQGGPCGGRPGQTVELLFDLRPGFAVTSDLVDTTLAAHNPTPGGGVSSLRFGVSPEVTACRTAAPYCVSNLRWTRGSATDGRGIEQSYRLKAPWSLLRWAGGTATRLLDADGRLVARFSAAESAGKIPWPLFGATDSVVIEDELGTGPAVVLDEAVGRSPDTTFEAPEAYPTARGAYAIHAADLNRDGLTDVVVVGNQGFFEVRLGTTRGGPLGEGRAYAMCDWPKATALADLSGDGYPELIIGGIIFAEGDPIELGARWGLEVHPGLPDGAFGEPVRYEAWPNDFRVGDFDRDGRPDLVIASVGNQLQWMRGLGDAGLGAPQVLLNTGENPGRMELVDLDADGRLDVIFVKPVGAGDTIRLYRHGADDELEAPTVLGLPIAPSGHAAGDVTGDGAVDLVLIARSALDQPSYVELCPGDGRGGLGAPVDLGAPPVELYPQPPVLADLDADGRLDVLATTYHGIWWRSTTVGADWQQLANTAWVSVTLADLDGDGTQDLLSLAGNNGDSVLETRRGRSGPPLTFLQVIPVERPRHVALTDLNEDGHLDLLSRNSFFGVDGGFDAMSPFRLSGENEGLAAGDLNRDGHHDIVVAHGNALYRHLGDGAGGFGLEAQIADLSPTVTDVAVGDVDGDGNLDAVAVSHSLTFEAGEPIWSNSFSFTPGNGDGTFGQTVEYGLTADAFARHVQLIDVNGDDADDVIISMAHGEPFMAYGRAGGPEPAHRLVGMEAYLSAGDVDGDGRLDLVSSYLGVAVAYARPGGGFAAPVRYGEPGVGVELLGVFDMDGDDRVELLLQRTQSVDVVGLDDGELVTGYVIPTGEAPTDVAVADLDADGLPDLLAASEAGGRLTVWHQPDPGSWRQRLREMPAQTVAAPSGRSTFAVHQGKQHIDGLTVRVGLAGAMAAGLRLTLRSPRGEEILLDPAAARGSDGPWSGAYGGPMLAAMHGWQPTGEWILIVDNPANVVELIDLTVITDGRFVVPSAAQ
ncbi:carboxypeptidase regulatory-like domain-containing protein [Myxococcota bacterium]|nr:carboxypeptidase regulatory-like domain-containing protein [Myxococcota bacterium]